jgi:putative membrane protein
VQNELAGTDHQSEGWLKYAWGAIFLTVLLWSGIAPKDRITWVLEVFPAVVGALVLALTWRRFPLTPLVYALILAHCIVLMVGGHYTYAEVPGFADWFGSARNNYDKLGHFFQGFVPALIVRELFLRKQVVPATAWRNFLIVCVCLAISAFYELIEWVVALASGEDAVAFLGTLGYVWDTQSDMALALLGAILALLALSRLHDRQLRRLASAQ